MQNTSRKILDYLQNEQKQILSFIQKLVITESPSLRPETQMPIFKMLMEFADEIDYEVKFIKGTKTGGHFFARPKIRQRGKFNQLILGHSDTVWKLGTLKKMPFEIGEGLVKGPGIYDMKCGIAQVFFGLKALKKLNLQPEITPMILITSDEEIGSFESRPYIERLSKISDRTFVLEPSLGRKGKLKTARKGQGHFDIKVIGKAAHAGLAPEEGASAILELSFLVQKLFALNNPEKGITVNVGTIDGGVRSNVIAAESSASIDVRVMTAEDAKIIEKEIRDLKPTVEGVSLEISGSMQRLPMEKTPRNQILWKKGEAIGKELGIELEQGISGGASDGNFTSLNTATLDGLGAVGDGAHAIHEFVNLEKSIERSALLSRLILEPPIKTND